MLKKTQTLNLTDVIFSGNVAGGYGGAIYSSGTNDTGAVDLRVTNAMFRNNIANDGKGGAIYTINNDVYLSDVIFDNNQAYTSTSYSDGAMAGQSMLPIIIATASILQVIR
ncbi:adhesin [Escherichia coli]|uniref:Adhesin n=1 Tax=Escherichia coli TaxID=562 RepID=A0A2X1K3F4_ECOLX|nr:adhesin [Escherichia coli]